MNDEPKTRIAKLAADMLTKVKRVAETMPPEQAHEVFARSLKIGKAIKKLLKRL